MWLEWAGPAAWISMLVGLFGVLEFLVDGAVVPFPLEIIFLILAFLLGFPHMRSLGTHIEWHLELADGQAHQLDITKYASIAAKFLVLHDGQELLLRRVHGRIRDKFEFQFGVEPIHHAKLIHSQGVALRPLRLVRVALEVDGERLADV